MDIVQLTCFGGYHTADIVCWTSLIESLGYILADVGRGTGPKGEKIAGRFTGTDSHDLGTTLDPFRIIFGDLGPDVFC